MGLCVGPDDMNLGLRGLRTLARAAAAATISPGLTVARWLEQRPEVLRVLHPALPSDPGHAIWKRDFTGACGLFGDRAQAGAGKGRARLPQRAHALRHGRVLGRLREPRHSRSTSRAYRTATKWAPGGPPIRFHIGLEDVGDLIADLERGFAALAAAK